MNGFIVGLAAAAAAPAAVQLPVVAPVLEAPLVISAAPVSQANAVLPANTEVLLSMNDTISTKGKRWGEGDNFDMTVTHAVRLGRFVIIPRGSKGVGRITWQTNKGMFGKSGKMEIDIEYVEVSGRRIPLSGHYRQEGEGNTVATIGGVVAVGLVAGLLITGKSGTIPAGREFTARTKEDLPVVIDATPPGPGAYTAPGRIFDGQIHAIPIEQSGGRRRNPTFDSPQVVPHGLKPGARVRCVTC